ncbi:MAG TPA: LacI family transcriptional regulator, partial [Thermoanaerobacter sp.]|nr:LacI family transcriptional regulator [Thermoanaerobacter sp.]
DINVANLVVPSLTTVRQPIKEIARKAIELILRQIDGEKVEKENILPITLIERETT